MLMFMAISIAGVSAADAESDQATVDKSDWQVGIALLMYDEADPVIRSTAALIPRLIHDELSGLGEHRLSDDESEILAREFIEDEIIKTYTALSGLYAARDRLFFDPNAEGASFRSQDELILQKKAELAFWRDFPVGNVGVPRILPLVLKKPDRGGDIWNTDEKDPELFRRHAGLDTLIGGSLVRVGEYLGLRIVAYGAAGGVVLWEGAVEESGIEDAVSDAGATARGLILGRPWSGIKVSVQPPEAIISAGGVPVGVGLWSDKDLEPGPMTLEISATGFRPQVREILLPENRAISLEVSLEASERPSTLVRSIPGGADVRLGSLWLGRTPLSVENPDRVMSLTIEKEGFLTRTLPFYPDSESLTIPMENIIVDPADELASARKKLHNSIAWFSVSLAPTFLLMGVSQNYANMNLYSIDGSEDQRFSYDAYYTARGFMWGSIGVNALLLTNVLFRLSRYLKAAESLSD